MEKLNREPVASGAWDAIYTWEMYASSEVPPAELVTAVACVALVDEDRRVVLTRNQRGGWEVLAGHVEPGETLKEALEREAAEEGGYVVSRATPFGYREITASERPAPDSRGAAYPFPKSYIAYFLARTNQPLGAVTGEEIVENRTFSLTELQGLVDAGELTEMEHTIITLGLSTQK